MNNQKNILLSLALLIIASFTYLSCLEQKQESFTYEKNWWVLSFSNVETSDLSFTIENYSSRKEFSYEIYVGNDKLTDGKIHLEKGAERKTDYHLEIERFKDTTLTVIASDGENKKEIYKKIP